MRTGKAARRSKPVASDATVRAEQGGTVFQGGFRTGGTGRYGS